MPPHPGPAPQYVAVARRDFQTTTYPLSPFHHRFLTAVQRLDSIDAALDDLAIWSQRPLEDVRNSWRTDVRQGWIDAGFFICREDA